MKAGIFAVRHEPTPEWNKSINLRGVEFDNPSPIVGKT